MSKLEITTAAHNRSHGRNPRGRGGWLFQQAATSAAYDHELYGEMVCHCGTYAEAKKALRATGAIGIWAVMP